MKNHHTTPWYKQFWPWFLILVPVAGMIFSITFLRLAMDTTDTLVVDDYYKQGKAINVRLDKLAKAKQLNIVTEVSIDNESVAVRFISGLPRTGEALRLQFFHTTLASKDNQILLTQDAKGVYRGAIDFNIQGRWRLTLSPLNEVWKVQRNIYLPQRKSFTLQFDK